MMELFTKKLNNRKGFTLIELIVVIAIIGILAAIMIPQFGGFTDKAKKTQALVNAKQFATAMDSMYAESITPTQASAAAIAMVTSAAVTNFSAATGAFTYTVTVNGKNYVAGRTSSTAGVAMK